MTIPAPRDGQSRESYQVLVVDDDSRILNAIAELLGNHGHTVLRAADGIRAWELFAAHGPDVVVCDVEVVIEDDDPGLPAGAEQDIFGGAEDSSAAGKAAAEP